MVNFWVIWWFFREILLKSNLEKLQFQCQVKDKEKEKVLSGQWFICQSNYVWTPIVSDRRAITNPNARINVGCCISELSLSPFLKIINMLKFYICFMSQPYVYEGYISYCDKAVTMVWLDESCFGLSHPYLSAKSGFEISWFLCKNIIFWISQTWLENVTKCSLNNPLVSYLHMLKSSLELWSLYVWHIQMWEKLLVVLVQAGVVCWENVFT